MISVSWFSWPTLYGALLCLATRKEVIVVTGSSVSRPGIRNRARKGLRPRLAETDGTALRDERGSTRVFLSTVADEVG